jgi:hypothetical protein
LATEIAPLELLIVVPSGFTPPRVLLVAVGREYVPAGVAHPSAFPLASTPCAYCPVVQLVPFAAKAVAVPALPLVLWLRVGKLVMFAALMVGAVWNDGAPAPPVAGPANTLFCAALDNENVNAGVLVAVATEVVNSGERFPAEKVVTVPLPDGFVYSHAVPLQCTKAAVDGAAIA